MKQILYHSCDGLFGGRTRGSLDKFAASEIEQGGNAYDRIANRNLPILLSVHSCKQHFPSILLGHLSQDFVKTVAGFGPGCPKGQDDGGMSTLEIVECPIINIYELIWPFPANITPPRQLPISLKFPMFLALF